MPNIGSTSDNISAVIERSELIKITHLSLPTANTEASLALQSNLKQLQLMLKEDSTASFKFAFVSTESGTQYIPVSKHCMYEITGIKFPSKVLYAQANKAGQTLIVAEFY